jgi:hypothetical protein
VFAFAQDAQTNETVDLRKNPTYGIAVYVRLYETVFFCGSYISFVMRRGFMAKATPLDTNGEIYDVITLTRSGLVKAYVLTIVFGVCESFLLLIWVFADFRHKGPSH